MKRLFAALAGVVALAVAGIALRAWLVPATPEPPPAGEPVVVDSRTVAQHLSQALQFQTVSYGNGVRDDEKAAALDAMRAWLETTYPAFHRVASREIFGRTLVFTWTGRDPHAPPVLLMAHQDVVPVVPGSERDWTYPPFSGEIAEGFVWGRGAIDDKGSLICLLEAADRLAAGGFTPARTIVFVMGQDEEVGGGQGSKVVAEALRARGLRFAWALDEGGAVVRHPFPGIEGPVAFVSVAEKGYLSLQLVAHGEGGHSSRPSPDLAIARLTRAVSNVIDHPFASGLDDIERTKLTVLAPLAPFANRLALANLWLLSSVVEHQMAATPDGAARLHTTIAPTMLNAGVKENVLPPTATAVINLRLHPRDTIAGATAHVRESVNDPKVDVTPLTETLAEASKVADLNGDAYAYVSRIVRRSFGGVPVAPDITTGATDSRHFLPIAGSVFRLFPMLLDASDLPRVHGTNERLAVVSLAPAVAFYVRLMQGL